MNIPVPGKKVLVTGGTRGIGRAIALGLAAGGADVAVCHRQAGPATDSLARELKDTGGDHLVVRADVGRPGDVEDLLGACRDRWGALDAVVCNAGTISHLPFAQLPRAEWDRTLATNLTGTFSVIQGALPLLSPGASLVLIGSKAAAVGVPLRAHYTATKSALTGFARSLCKELGPQGVRVNVLAPGIIDTQELTAEQTRRYESLISLRRLGGPEEIAHVVAFLVSDLSSYLTGETINVDGGT
ncbi:SDR family NAD(P)-dependent oxidoreductase [Streptomyces sp. NPDC057362]|uniref:SDR family NAD(P)-dependent oxidoreductase n=1 Tax=unclassified Streptomyces TaxID=2593676 RepID=UPI0036392B3F